MVRPWSPHASLASHAHAPVGFHYSHRITLASSTHLHDCAWLCMTVHGSRMWMSYYASCVAHARGLHMASTQCVCTAHVRPRST